MNGWKIVSNPPFVDGLFSEPQTAAWEALKQQFPLGTLLTGKIYIQAQFGVFYDAGLGFPVLINVPEFGKPEGGMIFPDDYPGLESEISGYLAQFDDRNRQLRTVKHWPIPPPIVSKIGLPGHPLISIDSQVRLGYACLVGTQISVIDVLDSLAGSLSIVCTLEEFPELTAEMVRACLRYASSHEKHIRPAGYGNNQ